MRLKGLLERNTLPAPEPGGEGEPAAKAAGGRRSPTRSREAGQPVPPPPRSFVGGLSPRSPRSLESPHDFKRQVELEARAATMSSALSSR